METPDLGNLIGVLDQLRECNDPNILLDLEESEFFTLGKDLVVHPILGYDYASLFLRAISDVFDDIRDQAGIGKLVIFSLNNLEESIAYQDAQYIALNFALKWSREMAKDIYNAFRSKYLKHKSEDGNLFVASLSLEGAIMLPILRSDSYLFIGALGLILNDFPDLPLDPNDPALLVVKALKLLGHCYDFRPTNKDIPHKISEFIGRNNFAVDAEAHYNYGIVRLYAAFQSNDAESLLQAMRDARNHFERAMSGQENRSDAELFSIIANCYVRFIELAHPLELELSARIARQILTERFLFTSETKSLHWSDVEYYLVQIIGWLSKWSEKISDATSWPNITPPMQQLAELYASIRTFNLVEGFESTASRSTQHLVLLPDLRSKFLHIQEASEKINRALKDPIWRSSAPESQVEFFKLAFDLLKEASDPKGDAANVWEIIRLAAEKDNPTLAEFLQTLETQSLTNDQKISKILERLDVQRKADLNVLAELGGANWDIIQNSTNSLRMVLDWDASSGKWKYLQVALRATAKYLERVYHTSPVDAVPGSTNFLYAKDSSVKGLGDDAVEANLENHAYNYFHLNEYGFKFGRQPIGETLGKPDLSFYFPNGPTFPVEIKREFSSIAKENIHTHFLAQAQSYSAGASQVSFLFVLDLTQKIKGAPLIDIRDCYYIDRIELVELNYPDCVIVVIIPANRYLPSDHSTYSRKIERKI